MSKSILVIDTPESCSKCLLYHGESCWGFFNPKSTMHDERLERAPWCPLQLIVDKGDEVYDT